MFYWLRRAFGSTWLLAAVLVVLLPVLAVLQYRWLQRLGRWERDRTLAILQAGADHAAEVFDRELASIYRTFQILLGPLTEDRLAIEVDLAWQRITGKTALDLDALISEVLWLPGPDAADSRPLRFDRSAMRMTTCDPPLLPAVAPAADPQAMPMVLLAGRPALVISQPTLGQGADAEGPQVIVIFDDRVLIDGFLAPLVERFLGGDGLPPMAGAVVPADGRGEALYLSDPTLNSEDFAQFDVAAPILRLRNDMLMIISQPLVEGPEPERKDVYDRPGDLTAGAGTGPGPGGGWQLRVKHPAGSVAGAVAAIRLRNQLIGFGILALLAAAMVLLMVSTRRAQRLARLQLDFVGSVSHELRTPLAVITAAGENLADAVVTDSERLQLYGRLIRREGTRLGQMVDSVLQFSRLRSEQSQTEHRLLQTDQLVARAVEGWKLVSEDDDCSVELGNADRVPVLGDEQVLLSAVQNLIGNAVKHGRGDERQLVTVNVVASAADVTDGNSAEVCISVCDHGPGIPDDEREVIFEPFRRGKLAMENQTAGSGLGLSLVLRAARAHGGRISLISEPGRGSPFTPHLPAAAMVAAVKAA